MLQQADWNKGAIQAQVEQVKLLGINLQAQPANDNAVVLYW